mgnify:CR=1 FL=1
MRKANGVQAAPDRSPTRSCRSVPLVIKLTVDEARALGAVPMLLLPDTALPEAIAIYVAPDEDTAERLELPRLA